MMYKLICDDCRKEFILDEIKVEESTVKRAGRINAVIVQYFRCPECGHKYIVSVQDDELKEMSKEYRVFMMGYDTFGKNIDNENRRLYRFNKKARAMKAQLMAEETMLLHAYQKQHKGE